MPIGDLQFIMRNSTSVTSLNDDTVSESLPGYENTAHAHGAVPVLAAVQPISWVPELQLRAETFASGALEGRREE